MANLVFQWTINLLETFIIVYFTFNYLILNRRYHRYYFLLVWLLLFVEVSFFNIKGAPYVIETGSQILTLILFAYFLSDDIIVIKLFIPVFAYVILYISNMLTLFSASFVMGIPIENLSDTDYFYLVIIISKVVFAFFSIILSEFRKKRTITEMKENWIILVPLIIMIWILSVNFLELILRGVINYKLLYLSIVILMISCILLYFLLEFLLKDTEKRNHEMLIIQQLKYQKENMEDIKALNEEIRKIKHDLKHKLSYIVEGLKDNKIEDMIKMLETSSKEIDKTNVISYSNNETLNYILQSKNKMAIQHGINMKCQITFEEASDIEDEDLIILLGNMLENAIEHSKKNDDINVCIKSVKGLLHIRISNSIENPRINTNITSKTDKRNHGFGMKSIRNIVTKYDGDIKEIIENDKFIIDILLKSH